jgi:hypothetical protein
MSKARREKRNEELEIRKLRSRTYTYEECLKMTKVIQSKYDMIYTAAAVCALNAEPFKFGKKRVGTFTKLFFDQVQGLSAGHIDSELMVDTCKELGIHIQQENGIFQITVEKGL